MLIRRSNSPLNTALFLDVICHVPTTKMRVNGRFHHHTFLFPWKVGIGRQRSLGATGPHGGGSGLFN